MGLENFLFFYGLLTFGQKSDVDEPRVDDDLRQQEAEGGDDVYEGSRRASVVPGVAHEAPGLGQEGRRVHRTGRQVVAEFVTVVGQVSDLEHERDEEKGEKHDAGPDEADEHVQLQIGLLPIGPGQGEVNHEARYALVNDIGLVGGMKKALG